MIEPGVIRSVNDQNNFNLDLSWVHSSTTERTKERFNEIKTYAYLAFDELDKDKNGFIDESELLEALNSSSTSEREKAFIAFLLDNRQSIADSFDEGAHQDPEGISRMDLEAYFKMISQLM